MNIDENGQLSLPNCVNIIIKQPHPISGELTDTVVATMNDIDTKADIPHKHTLSDITDYKPPTPYDDTSIRNAFQQQLAEVRGLIDGKADIQIVN